MTEHRLECLHSFDEFMAIRDDWDRFMATSFPENYARSHPWLAAWWATYHHRRPALVYLQRHWRDNRIIAAAPLLIRWDRFGGFPVRAVQSIGSGIGSDDFLVSPESRGFTAAVFDALHRTGRWELCRLRRCSPDRLRTMLAQVHPGLERRMEPVESDDYYIAFPASYAAYHQSRSRKFRRNLNQALNRLEREGTVTMEVLDPFRDAARVATLGRAVAGTSWQYRAGKSHFNDSGSASFYANLARTGCGAGGEEFSVLLVADRPVAYLLGCRRGHTYYAVDTAFHADYRHVSAGRILFGRVFERLIRQGGVDYFDFEGSGDYKDDYATDRRRAVSLVIYNHTLYPRCIKLLRETGLYARLRSTLCGDPGITAAGVPTEQAEAHP
ncbi:GNAT family N-acetyltransferase [Trichlorobacter ammonificans]|uniref:BioF2-like acetyltransferase domain-containing protein n=1 Tax=Trichlorobacter ammonificans TaxID=2916410 RepID=A0ABM9D9I8_9BACT|nr:GNAT family N-acetyltransferase [Trichlorobacter ammonificans]CAH2031394.1 protein of unknown function [Trichlorobacter ammonificans]